MLKTYYGEGFGQVMALLEGRPSPDELDRLGAELTRLDPKVEAEEAAESQARAEGGYGASSPGKFGVLTSITRNVTHRLSSTMFQLANCRRRNLRLSQIEDEVSDHLDTIGEADPDLARRLGGMLEGGQ